MPNNNVAILSIMSKFDEKSAREAAKRADKVYEEALSDIGNVNFDKKLIENFDKAMNLLKNKFKKVNLSSYTNSLLDSIFSDKDIKEKSEDIELFISKIEMLKNSYVTSKSAPRGRIYDRNGVLIVDNEPVKVIM